MFSIQITEFLFKIPIPQVNHLSVNVFLGEFDKLSLKIVFKMVLTPGGVLAYNLSNSKPIDYSL